MMKKALYLSFALLFCIVLFGLSSGYAQGPITDFDNQSSKVTQIAQNGDNGNDDDTDWGWIGLVGLAGLLGLRRNDKK